MCKYCYANYNKEKVQEKSRRHNPDSPLLIGEVGPEDRITNKKIFSFISKDSLF
jgi:hypothetical protein